jgi:tetratricopeptide (TPR) repeat protein
MYKIIIIVLLFAIAFVSCGVKYVPIETGVMVGIQQLYESKQYDAVIAQLEPLLEKHPTDVKGHHTLIRCYAEKQQLEIVEERYKQAVEKHPKTAALWFALGYVYYWQGIQQNDQAKFQEAVKTLEHALSLDANIAMAHRMLGDIFFFKLKEKNIDCGIEELNAAIRLTPPSETSDIAQDYTWLGVAYTKKGMYENALDAFKNAMKLGTKVEGVEEELKKVEVVLEKLKAVEANPEDAQAHYALGEAYFSLRDPSQAIAEYKKAIELGLKTDVTYVRLGIAFIGINSYPEAITAWEEALKLNPKNEKVRKLINLINAQQAVEKNPTDADAYFRLGEAWSVLGGYTNAVIAYQKAIELGQRYLKNYQQLGIAYLNMESYDKAIDAFEAALQIDQKKRDVQNYLKFAKAKRVLKEHPNDADAHFEIGNVYYSFIKFDDAIAEYKKAMEISPDCAQASEWIEKAQHAKRAGVLFETGKTAEDRAEHQKALEAYKEAIEIYRSIGNRELESLTLGFVGNVYHSTDDYPKALEYYKEALTIAKEIGDRQGEAGRLGNIGNVYHSTGDYPKALECYQQALTITKKIGDRVIEAKQLGNIGDVDYFKGDYKNALEYYQQALTIAQAIIDRKDEAACLGNIGNVYYSKGGYQKALEYHQQALSISKEIRDRKNEADQLGNMGSVYYSKGDYQKALEYHQQALTIVKEIGNRMGEADMLGKIGNVYNSTCDYQKALESYQQAMVTAKEIGYREGEATQLGGIGNVYCSTGDYPKAFSSFQQALSINKEIGNRMGEADMLGNMGNIYDSTGDYPKAFSSYQQAMAISKEIGYRKGEAINLGNMGNVYYSTGDYLKALENYQQSLNIAKEIDDRAGQSAWLGNIGGVYFSTGDYPEALKNYQQSLNIAKKIGDREGEAACLGSIGGVYFSTGDYPKALDFYQQALTIDKDIGTRASQAVLLGSIGDTHQEIQEYPQALDYLNQALQLSREIGIRSSEAYILSKLGKTHQALNNFEQAWGYLQAGFELAQTLGIPNAAWQCQFHIGEIAEQQGKPEEAITHYKQAAENIESMREKLKTKEVQAFFMRAFFMRAKNKTEVYERLIKLLIELGREEQEEAFEYLEQSKSETLREAVERVKPKVKDEKVWEILEELERLENKLDATASRLVEAKSKEEVENLTKLLAETKGQVNQVMMDLRSNHPETYQFPGANYDVLYDIQKRIPPDTLLVEYCVLPEETCLFLITRNSFTLKPVPVSREQLNTWVLDYGEGIQKLYDVSELSSKLYRILIEPIEVEIAAVKTVTIVPYGLLYYLPFHALERTTETGERQFLIQWKRVSYLTTSSLRYFANPNAASADTPAQPLVAFGNPDGTLEGALKEVEALKTIIPDATVYVLDAAQKQVFLATAGEYLIVHLATHGQLDEDPKRSYLVFAPKGVGNLTAWEIAGLVELFRKHRSIVVLSACNTAVEKIRKEHKQGMAVMSLADAFARAGCPTLIASLWAVSDKSTQQLMVAFYRALNNGQGDILDALRQAQLKVMQTEGWDDEAGVNISYAHPRYWAPFILIGEWQQ